MIQKIDTHAEDAAARRVSQYKDSVRVADLLRVAGDTAQRAEDAMWSFRFTLADAAGAQLDLLGRMTGVERLGRSDSEYRAEIPRDTSPSGVISDLIYAGDGRVVVADLWNASTQIANIGGTATPDFARASMAGTRAYVTLGAGPAFGLGDATDPNNDDLSPHVAGLDVGKMQELIDGN